MSQYSNGFVRTENGSTTVRGSWKATASGGDPENFVADETVDFVGSGATGRFMSYDALTGIIRFVVLTGTPAHGDAMERTAGPPPTTTINNPEEETVWTDSIQPFLATIVPQFTLSGGARHTYDVVAVVSNTQLTLGATYSGSTATAQAYLVAIDFSPNRDYPLIARGDLETAALMSRAVREIDADIATILGASAINKDFDGAIVLLGNKTESVSPSTWTHPVWTSVLVDTRSSNPGVTDGWFDATTDKDRFLIPAVTDVAYFLAGVSVTWAAAHPVGLRRCWVARTSGVFVSFNTIVLTDSASVQKEESDTTEIQIDSNGSTPSAGYARLDRTTAGGSFITDGFHPGDRVYVTGFADPADGDVFVVDVVAALTMDLIDPGGTFVGADVGSGNERVRSYSAQAREVYQTGAKLFENDASLPVFQPGFWQNSPVNINVSGVSFVGDTYMWIMAVRRSVQAAIEDVMPSPASWTNITLSSPWINTIDRDAGSGYAPASYKNYLGFVELRGTIEVSVPNSVSSGDPIFTLPPGQRPNDKMTFGTVGERITIDDDTGIVSYEGNGMSSPDASNIAWLTLDGLRFQAEK